MADWIPNAIAILIAACLIGSLLVLAYAHRAGKENLRKHALVALKYSGIAVLIGVAAVIAGVIVIALETFGGG